MATLLPTSAVEAELKAYLRNLNINGLGTNVWRMLDTTEVTTPAVFVIAGKETEVQPFSKIYRVPFTVRIVYVTADVQENPGALDTLTYTVENSLTGSQQSINSTSSELFIFSVSNPTHAIEVVENTYQYAINGECVCKSK